MFLIAPGLFVLPMDRSGTPANAFKAGSQGVPVGGGAEIVWKLLLNKSFAMPDMVSLSGEPRSSIVLGGINPAMR